MLNWNHMRERNQDYLIQITRVMNVQKLMKMMIPLQKHVLIVDSVLNERFLIKLLCKRKTFHEKSWYFLAKTHQSQCFYAKNLISNDIERHQRANAAGLYSQEIKNCYWPISKDWKLQKSWYVFTENQQKQCFMPKN